MAIGIEVKKNRYSFPPGLMLAVILGLMLIVLAYSLRGFDYAMLALIGLMLGATLYHAKFGFTAAWRKFIVLGDGQGLRAQMVMLAIAVLIFFPALSAGELFGSRVSGFVAPVGVSVMVGAFIFGIGMQLGGGCASGTLFTSGGGNTKMMLVLFFFVLGSVIATHHLNWWLSLPNIGPVSLIKTMGLTNALILHLSLFLFIFLLTLYVERRRKISRADEPQKTYDLLRGPWPYFLAAVLLALLNAATLYFAHRPWGVTSAFALWGAKGGDLIGFEMQAWPYWANQYGRIERSVFLDTTSLMNFGIMIGAFMAAHAAGAFKPKLRLSGSDWACAVVGGLMLGYGARLAFGCNIGAFFSGVSSGSLHGWLWLVCAFAGSFVGIALRPAFGLTKA